MNYSWSERVAVTGVTDADAVASVIATHARLDLLLGTGGDVQVLRMGSIDGGWQTPVEVVSDEAFPSGVNLQGRYALATVGGNPTKTVRFWRLADDGSYAPVGSAVDVYESMGTAQYPSLAVHPDNWRVFVATRVGSKTIINSSPDAGATWHENDVDGVVWPTEVVGLQYPVLCCDKDYLWLVGWRAGVYLGAAGKVECYQFTANSKLEQVGSAVTVGPSDEGKPGFIRRPKTGEMLVLAPKTAGGWSTLSGNTTGIVEYWSVNTGSAWTQQVFHEVP